MRNHPQDGLLGRQAPISIKAQVRAMTDIEFLHHLGVLPLCWPEGRGPASGAEGTCLATSTREQQAREPSPAPAQRAFIETQRSPCGVHQQGSFQSAHAVSWHVRQAGYLCLESEMNSPCLPGGCPCQACGDVEWARCPGPPGGRHRSGGDSGNARETVWHLASERSPPLHRRSIEVSMAASTKRQLQRP